MPGFIKLQKPSKIRWDSSGFPSERLDHIWNTKKKHPTDQQFFSDVTYPVWTKLTKETATILLRTSLPHQLSLWKRKKQWFFHISSGSKLHITNDPTTASNSAAGKGKDSAQPCTAWKSTPGHCCESAENGKKLLEIKNFGIGDLRFVQTKVQIHRFQI